MSASSRSHGKKNPSRPMLAAALAVLLLGVALFLASLALGGSPNLQGVARGLRTALPYVFIVGFTLLVIYVVVRPRRNGAALRKDAEPTFIPRDSTDFAHLAHPRATPAPRDPLAGQREQRPPTSSRGPQRFDDSME